MDGADMGAGTAMRAPVGIITRRRLIMPVRCVMRARKVIIAKRTIIMIGIIGDGVRLPGLASVPACSPASRPLRAGCAGGPRPALTRAARADN